MEKCRLLLLLPQIPHDPGSGAARTMALTTALCRSDEFELRAIGTTASEAQAAADVETVLCAQKANVIRTSEREIFYELDDLPCTLLDVGGVSPSAWRREHAQQFDALLERTLLEFAPGVVFTYGGRPDDLARLKRLREANVAVVLGLWNLGYLKAPRSFFESYDAVVTPSRYLADVYRACCGIYCTVFPTPIFPEQVRSANHQPIFFTTVNPTWEKGLGIMIRIAEMLGRMRPDIPLLIIESRGTAGQLLNIARAAGLDLARHNNIMFSPSVAAPVEFFAVTRATIVPSLVSEGSGRIASESMVAGVPALVSDRGGLPGEVGNGGFVFPLPDSVRPDRQEIASEEIAMPWFQIIQRLTDDEDFYQAACARARSEGIRFVPETVGPLYRNFFKRVRSGDSSLRPFESLS